MTSISLNCGKTHTVYDLPLWLLLSVQFRVTVPSPIRLQNIPSPMETLSL